MKIEKSGGLVICSFLSQLYAKIIKKINKKQLKTIGGSRILCRMEPKMKVFEDTDKAQCTGRVFGGFSLGIFH